MPNPQLNQMLGGFATSLPQTSTPTTDNQSSIPDDLKSQIINVIQENRGKYSDGQILNGLISDNKDTHPEIANQLQSWMGSPLDGTQRTDRNNMPIAASVKTNGTNEFTKALDAQGIKWTYGDPFPGNSDMSTIKILGDPLQASKAILSSTSSIESWYGNHTGKSVLDQYKIKTATDFQNASPDIQNKIVQGIYNAENGTTNRQVPLGYDPKTILDGLISDNQTTPQSQPTQGTNADGSSQIVSDPGSLENIINTFKNGPVNFPFNPITLGKGLLGMAEPATKIVASNIRNLQSIPAALSGNFDQANDITKQPLFGQPTLAGSSPAQNVGSALNAGSNLVGLGSTLPAITGNEIVAAGLGGFAQGTLSGEGQYLASNQRPSLKTSEGQKGALTSGIAGGLTGLAVGAGSAAIKPFMTGEVPALDLIKNKQNEILNEKTWQMVKDPKLEANINKSTLTGTVASVEPTTPHDNQLIEAAKPYVTDDPIQTKANLQNGVATESQALESELKGKGGTWSQKTLQGILNDTKVPLKIRSPEGMVVVKNVNNYVMELANDPSVSRDASGGLTMSKLFRRGITTEYGENIWNKDTPDAQYIRNVNRQLNGLTESRLPDGNLSDGTPYTKAMQKISLLSEARDNVEIPKEGTQKLNAVGTGLKIGKDVLRRAIPYGIGAHIP